MVILFYFNAVEENFIGNVDVRTQNVHFNVQRDDFLDFASTSSCNGCITFEREVLNIGGGIDKNTGYFSAPVTGTYHFEFSAMGENRLHFYFYKKDSTEKVAAPYADAAGPVSFTASLQLEEGEQMILQMESGSFSSGIGGPSILYTGWLVEQEL